MPKKTKTKKREQPGSRTKGKTSNKKGGDELEESWYLDKVLSLEELSNEHVIMCKNETCQLQAWMIYKGNISDDEWPSCIDCMLNDYQDWPSIELISDMKDIFPIDTNLELFIRNKCTNNQNLQIPIHISNNIILHQFIASQNEMKTITTNEDLPKLQNPYVIVNTINKSTDNDIISNITDNETLPTMNSQSSRTRNDADNDGPSEENLTSTSSVKVKKSTKPEKTRFSSRMEKLEEDGLVDLSPKIFDSESKTLHKKGLCIMCIPYKTYRVKSEGTINLRRKFYEYYYDQHCKTKNHIESIQMQKESRMRKSGAKSTSSTQSMLHNYFPIRSNNKAEESSTRDKEENLSRTSEADDSTSKDSSLLLLDCSSSSTEAKNSSDKTTGRRCVGVVNSVSGSKKKMVANVHKYIKCSLNSSYQFGIFSNLPAIYSKGCTNIGTYKAIDGGLCCKSCLLLRRKPGNSNPIYWISKCHWEIENMLQRRRKKHLTSVDLKELGCLMKMNGIQDRYTEKGLELYNECKSLYEYLKEAVSLNNRMKQTKPLFKDDEIDNSSTLFEKADQLYKENKSFRSNIVICLLKAIVAKQSSGHNNLVMEQKLVDFYRYLRTLGKQSCKFVTANLGLGGKGISDRWLRELNRKDRGDNIFRCDKKSIYNNLKQLLLDIPTTTLLKTFAVSIDGSRCPKSININTAHKCIFGRSFPNHIISTQNLSKEEINNILYTDYSDLASEIKVPTVCAQNVKKGTSPMAIIAARPQSVNAVSDFTADVCAAANMIVNEYKGTSFSNFATDGVSVETKDIMYTMFSFLDKKVNYLGAVDNKHNVKNHRYQYIGGSNVATIGTYILVLRSHLSYYLFNTTYYL